MARIAIFLDHDIVIRHFVLNGVLQALGAEHELTFIFPEGHRRVKTNLADLGLREIRTLPIDENRSHAWRRLYQHQALRSADRGMNREFLHEFWKETLGEEAYASTRKWSRGWRYFVYRWKALRTIGENEPLESLLSAIRPDVILHPTVLEGLFVSDLIRSGRRRGIPTVYLMNSWDNPSTKAMTIGKPDWLVVWGEQTKHHSIKHLKMNGARVLCFGAAQFDIYREPAARSREEYRQELGVSPTEPLVVYAGSSKGVREVQHLQRLDKAIENGSLSKCKILFRPHPWRGKIEGEHDFGDIEWKNVLMDPTMVDYYQKSRVDPSIIFTPDISETHVVLNACDLLISPVSTILLEAAMHGRPIIAYLPREDIHENFFLRTMANMNFMQEFFNAFECGPVQDFEDLLRRLNEMVARDPLQEGERIRELVQYFVATVPDGYAENVSRLVHRIVSKENREKRNL